MESLVFVLFLTVVTVVWMGQIVQPRLVVSRVRQHRRMLMVLGQNVFNTSWHARDAEWSSRHAKRWRSAPQGRAITTIRVEADHSST